MSKVKEFLKKRKRFVYVVLALVVVGLIYVFRSLFVAAVVNGYPITRIELTRELESEAGREALDTLVTKKLVLQEAKKQTINVADSDIDAQIADIESQVSAQGQKLDDVLALQGISRDELRDRVKFQIILTKLVGDQSVSDDEVNKYIEDNKASITDPTSQDTKDAVKQQLLSQKQSTAISDLLDKLKKDAKINYFLNF